ncbi:MAG: polysaccharide biosynthesis C-terminal domain-containing protein, partial [Oscillospiraceae bacterium]|nr:polysaccharide biosynthesis C-terminal domain-containing protein [Oscillospiraceae bacterium]
MDQIDSVKSQNPLEYEPIGKLMFRYSIPAIISSLVGSIYNIVDQIFIGNKIGELGNAATNVAFPLVMIITTLAMTFGVGGASSFSLYLGSGEKKKARSVVGTAMFMLIASGITVGALSAIFTRPMLTFFGGRGHTLEYAIEYTRIVALGTPFAMLETGASQLIRADGSPRYAMASNLTGAVLNCILDPIFIFALDMGMSGAALATIIGQFVGAVLMLCYFPRFKSFKLSFRSFIPKMT